MLKQLHSAFTLFLSLLVEAMPFLLLGVLLSSLLLIFVDERKFINKMPKNPFLGALFGSFVGFLFPVCECGNIPVARRLLMQGMPTPVAFGFLLAAPTINPIVIWSTWVAFRDQPEIVVFRVIFSLAIATIIAWVFSVQQKDLTPLLHPRLAKRIAFVRSCNVSATPAPEKPSLLQSGTFLLEQGKSPLQLNTLDPMAATLNPTNPTAGAGRWSLFVDNVIQELRELGGILILGSAIAVSIQVFVPREVVLNLGQGTVSSIVAMMLLAAIVSICSTVDSFFALSFASTFTTSSLLAFLVFGPMIDLKSIGLMLSIFRPRMLIYLIAITAQLTFVLTLSHSYLF